MRKQRDLNQWQQSYLYIAQQLQQTNPQLTLSHIEALARRLLIQNVLPHLVGAEEADEVRCGLLRLPAIEDIVPLSSVGVGVDDVEGSGPSGSPAPLDNNTSPTHSLLSPTGDPEGPLPSTTLPPPLRGMGLATDEVGHIYEQCLSYRLVEGEHGMHLAIDQSTRQHTGSYYTPRPVVCFLLEMTIGQIVQAIKGDVVQALRQKHYQNAQSAIARLATLRVLDISCGAGIFLLEAARLLIEAYQWWNTQLQEIFLQEYAHNEAAFQETRLQYVIEPAQIVLRNCIFGMDCDAEAVAITRLNLRTLAYGSNAQQMSDALVTNILLANALTVPLDMYSWLGTEPHQRVIVGNPPWGSHVQCSSAALQQYTLAKGQYDAYELFIERATQWLRHGDRLAYVVPDSMLHLPQHTRLRQMLVQSYHIETLVKLGEGVFADVFRGCVAFSATKCEQSTTGHEIRCCIVVKAERKAVLQQEQYGIETLLMNDGNSIAQARFRHNKDVVFDLFTNHEDEHVLDTMAQHALNWRELFLTGRGVEISKIGAIMACPACHSWQNIPRKQKNGRYASVQCIHAACRQTLSYDECQRETLIVVEKDACHRQAIIVGEHLHRYMLSGQSYLDVSKGPYINYKSPSLYSGEKLLVRKTGRGIYATIDKTGAYTNQVVFIFKLNPHRPEAQQGLRLSYVLGVLNSRMMLYRYYKALGDVEWKSFPYMTQDTIMGLPIRQIDFTDARQVSLHDRIADLVDGVIEHGKPPERIADNEIEHCVRLLYGVATPTISEHIDAELQRISSYGSLLGEQR